MSKLYRGSQRSYALYRKRRQRRRWKAAKSAARRRQGALSPAVVGSVAPAEKARRRAANRAARVSRKRNRGTR